MIGILNNKDENSNAVKLLRESNTYQHISELTIKNNIIVPS
jgi:hypothetical protein